MRNVKNTQEPEVTNRIFTAANIISMVRLCLIPVFVIVFFCGNDALATFVFALSACTDFVDGQVARRTNTVSKLGQLLDPAVDRLLMITGVLCLLVSGRLPVWIVIVVIVRDLYLLAGGAYLLKRYQVRVPVVYAGKFATTFLFTGFASLLLNWPIVSGLGLISAGWLPGFTTDSAALGIWLIYAGLALAIGTTIYYTIKGWRLKEEAKATKKQVAHG